MMRNKYSLIVGTLAAAAVFAFASQADAGWGSSGSWGSSSSSSGGWGSSSSSSGGWGSSSSSSGGWRHHGWRRAYRGSSSSSSSSGSWGRRGWGSSSSSSGGYGYHSYSYGSSSSSSGGYSYGSSSSSSSGGSAYQADGNWTPVEDNSPGDAPAPPAEAPADAPAPPADSGTSIQDRNTTVSFSVSVPEEAQIFVNDNATTSTGTERTYISRGLQAGKSYTFHVRAEVTRNGKTLTETKKIRLVAGQHTALAFQFAPNADEQLADKPVETKLTLKVPAEAKVYLSGRATTSTGEVREFATTKLVPGKSWADYTVVVTYEKDGQLLTQEKNVTIKAGDSSEVTFDFNSDRVAAK